MNVIKLQHQYKKFHDKTELVVPRYSTKVFLKMFQNPFLINLQALGVFFCGFREILKSNFFCRTPLGNCLWGILLCPCFVFKILQENMYFPYFKNLKNYCANVLMSLFSWFWFSKWELSRLIFSMKVGWKSSRPVL